MKSKYLNFALIFVTLLSIIINFNSFLMGHDSSLLGIITTITYIVFWFLFIVLSKNSRKALVFSIVWSLLTLACASVTLAANINDRLIVDFAIPFAMVFITPLYAIEAFFSQSGFLIVSIVLIIISLAWFTLSFFFLSEQNEHTSYQPQKQQTSQKSTNLEAEQPSHFIGKDKILRRENNHIGNHCLTSLKYFEIILSI